MNFFKTPIIGGIVFLVRFVIIVSIAGKVLEIMMLAATPRDKVIPFDSIYIEVSASLTGKATVGFAADYDGLIVIEAIELIRARQKGDCALSADTDAGIVGKVWKYDSGTMKFTK